MKNVDTQNTTKKTEVSMEDKKKKEYKYKNDFQKEKYDRIIVNVDKGKKKLISDKCEEKNISINKYITNLISKDLNEVVFTDTKTKSKQ